MIEEEHRFRLFGSVPQPALGTTWPPNPVWIDNGVTVSFQGWNTNPDGSGTWYTAASPLENSRRLYAIFGGGVNFNANGGLFPNNTPSHNIPFFGGELGQQFTMLPTPTFETPNGNLRFRHWNTLEDTLTVPGTVVNEQTTPTNGQTFWAQWDVPITFNPGIGTWPTGAATGNRVHHAPYDGSLDPDTTGWQLADNGMPPDPILLNHTFMGWRYAGQAVGTPHLTSAQVLEAIRTVPRTYTAVFYLNVVFDLNGGTYAAGIPANRPLGTEDVLHPTPLDTTVPQDQVPQTPALARTGFVFVGWRYNGQATGTPHLQTDDIITRPVTAPLTYTAQWEIEVRFVLNGGTYAVGTPINRPLGTEDVLRPVLYGSTLNSAGTMPGNPTREHYHFGGWQRVLPALSTVTTDSPTTVGERVRAAAGYEYIAVWYPIIRFELAGGQIDNDPGPITRTVRRGTTLALVETPLLLGMPADPVRTGWTFMGWRYDGQASGTPHLTSAYVRDTANRTEAQTYTAVWYPVITFELAGGHIDNDLGPVFRMVRTGETLNLVELPTFAGMPADPVRDGYEFGGWRSVAGTAVGSEIVHSSADVRDRVRTEPARYMAVWDPVITFDLAGGIYDCGDDIARPTHTQDVIRSVDRHTALGTDMPGNPTRAGYHFIGWQASGVGPILEPSAVAATVRTASTTYVAVWYPIVTFYPNGGTIPGYAADETVTRIVRHGGTLALVELPTFVGMPDDPERAGYAFVGWRRVAATAVGSQTIYTSLQVETRPRTEPARYIAVWDPIIIFNPGLGTIPASDPNAGTMPGMDAGEEVTRTVTRGTTLGTNMPGDPTLHNHAFAGWRYEGQDPATPHLTSAQVRDAVHVLARTYTAVWYPLITFHLAGGMYDDSPANIVRIVPIGTSLDDIDEMPGDPAREGYVFGGWRRVAASVTASGIFTPQQVGERDRYAPYLYMAVWNPVITFNLAGGTYDCGDAVARPDGTAHVLRSVDRHTALGTDMPGNPTRTGYTFMGWRASGVEPTLEPSDVAATIRTESTTYVAVWQPITGGGGGGGGGGGPTPTPTPTPTPDPWRQAFLIGMPDGTVRPNANITRAEVATIFFRLIADDTRTANWTQSNPFDDVALERWFNNAISTTTNMGLFQGVGDDLFAPNRSITRGELAAVLVRFAGTDTGLFSASDQFSDIAGHWAQAYINEAARQGWIRGYADGTFRPNQPITRAETAAMVTRIFERLVYSVDDLLDDRVRFSDLMNQNAWFYLYMASATNSFTYQRANADDIFLTWIEIIEPRDWRVLERPYSQPGDILG